MYEVQQHHIQGGGVDWALYDPAKSCVFDEAQARMVAEVLRTGSCGVEEGPESFIVDVLDAEDGGKDMEYEGDYKGPEAAVQQCPVDASWPSQTGSLPSVQAGALPAVRPAQPQAAALPSPSKHSASARAAARVSHSMPAAVNLALVQRFLNMKGGAHEPMRILLEDFGGQESFYELYSILFSEYAIYILVFNMEWLRQDSPNMVNGLEYVRHWLHTVGVYCRNTSIMMVGTHKDKVQQPREHELISKLLRQHFREHPSWPFVSEWQDEDLSTGRGALCFFPVDNTLGNRDPVIGALMRQVEVQLRASEHMQHRVPFMWMALLDRMEVLKHGGCLVVSRDEFRALCSEVGFPSAPGRDVGTEMDLVLRFFNRLGLLMHHRSVPHLVILRPAEFLFPYFTKIICDFKMHTELIPQHAAACKRYPREFQRLQTKGILSASLFGPLWEGNKHHDAMRQLMVSLGLMVPLLVSKEDVPAEASHDEFLVPSILPLDPTPTQTKSAVLTARVVFAVTDAIRSWRRSGYLLLSAVRRETQVPAGVFSRLLGAIASLCQQTAPFPCVLDMRICRNEADFELGRSRFTLTNDRDYLSVYIEEGTGYSVSEMLQGQLKTIVDRYLPGFDFVILVPAGGCRTNAAGSGLANASESEYLTILSGQMGIKARVERMERMNVGPRDMLSAAELRERFRDWVEQRGLDRDGYDFFLSYRQMPNDEDLTLQLYTELGMQVVRANEAPRTFLDKMRLETGRNFMRDFAASLCRTRIAVVLLSVEALRRMTTSDQQSPNLEIEVLRLA